MLTNKISTLGLSDAGAHVRSICDGSQPTFMLTHWARDRHRGERLPLEAGSQEAELRYRDVVRPQRSRVLMPGFRADVNVIDYENLTLEMPETVTDLPAGGSRLQKARGYDYTIVNGEITIRNGQITGATRAGCSEANST